MKDLDKLYDTARNTVRPYAKMVNMKIGTLDPDDPGILHYDIELDTLGHDARKIVVQFLTEIDSLMEVEILSQY